MTTVDVLRPPAISKFQIRSLAQKLFQEYLKECGEDHVYRVGLNFDDFYDAVFYPKYEIGLHMDQNLGVTDEGEPILGQFLPKDNVVLIDKSLKENNDPRTIFTLYHEVPGHGILHGPMLREAGNTSPLISTNSSINDPNNDFEKQANFMAAELAAPTNLLCYLWITKFGTKRRIVYRGPGTYTLCYCGHDFYAPVKSPSNLAWIIATRLQHYFWGLSKESLSYRVMEVIVDSNGFTNKDFHRSKRTISSVGEVMERMRSQGELP